jgi:hypothetical protein
VLRTLHIIVRSRKQLADYALNVVAYVSNFTKVLYANFEAIFTDIEKAVPNFYKLNYNLQWEKLNEFVKPYLEEINSQNEPLRIDFGTIEDPNPEDDN